MPRKSTKQPPKQESALLQILPPKKPDPVPEPIAEPTSESIVELAPKPVPEPEVKPIARKTEPQVEPTAEPTETPADEPSQTPKKVVSVVPRKVQEAAALGIELEPPPEEIVIPEGTIFQAIGIISGLVAFVEEPEGQISATITFSGKTYPLYYAPHRKRSFIALKKEIEATGKTTQRLLVYPKVTHYPGRDQDYTVGFQLVGFDSGLDPDSVATKLQDGEFQLCGLWQFIPVCRTPCISVFKNFTRERLEHIKESETIRKVKFMKASHLPLFWRDAPVAPFRFNPRATKEEQGKPVFVEVKAQFNPYKAAFEFRSLLGVPLTKSPRFLKANKEDKAAAMAEKKARKMEQEAAERAAEREAKRAASGANVRPQPKPKPRPQPRVQ